MKIVIDCGHGGIDKDGNYTTAPKKMAKVNGTWVYEGFINRQIGGMLGTLLEWDGHEVIYTVHPNDSRDLSLAYRVKVANQHPEALFLSIHNNAFDGTARGFEIYTTRGETESDKLAESIADEVEKYYKQIGLKLRYDFSDGDKDKEVDFYVLRKTKGVAVLIECLFFDNILDWAKLNDLEFRQNFVASLYKGVTSYIS